MGNLVMKTIIFYSSKGYGRELGILHTLDSAICVQYILVDHVGNFAIC